MTLQAALWLLSIVPKDGIEWILYDMHDGVWAVFPF